MCQTACHHEIESHDAGARNAPNQSKEAVDVVEVGVVYVEPSSFLKGLNFELNGQIGELWCLLFIGHLDV